MISGRMSDKISSCVRRLRRALPAALRGIASEDGEHLVDPRLDPAREIAMPEFRRDDRVEDGARSRIRERSFRAIARFDAQLALLGSDEQERPVVLVLLPDSPGAKELVRIILDRKLPERGHGRDHDLIRRLVLIGLELRFDTLARVGREEDSRHRPRAPSAPGKPGRRRSPMRAKARRKPQATRRAHEARAGRSQ